MRRMVQVIAALLIIFSVIYGLANNGTCSSIMAGPYEPKPSIELLRSRLSLYAIPENFITYEMAPTLSGDTDKRTQAHMSRFSNFLDRGVPEPTSSNLTFFVNSPKLVTVYQTISFEGDIKSFNPETLLGEPVTGKLISAEYAMKAGQQNAVIQYLVPSHLLETANGPHGHDSVISEKTLAENSLNLAPFIVGMAIVPEGAGSIAEGMWVGENELPSPTYENLSDRN